MHRSKQLQTNILVDFDFDVRGQEGVEFFIEGSVLMDQL